MSPKKDNTHGEINIIWVARRKNPEDTIQSQCHFLVHNPQKSHLHFFNFETFRFPTKFENQNHKIFL